MPSDLVQDHGKLAAMTKPPPEKDEQLEAARAVAARRRTALRDLAQWEIAERIMEEDREILSKLAKS
jgi:hypothetical protein